MPHGSFMFAHLVSRGTTWFFSLRISLQKGLYREQIYSLLLEQRAGLFTIHYNKDKVSLWDKDGTNLFPIIKYPGSLNLVIS